MNLLSTKFLTIVAIGIGLPFFSGCGMVISDGHQFTFQGKTALTQDQGEIEASVEQIKIVNKFGSVKVRPVPAGDSPTWNWNAKVWSPTQEQAEAFAEQLIVEVKSVGNQQTWTLLMPEPDADLDGVESNFEVFVGQSVSVDIDNAHGDVDVADVAGALKLENRFGDLKLESFQDAEVSVHHGDGYIKSGHHIDLKGGHGSLVVASIGGNATVDASHTEVTVNQVEGTADLKTSFEDLLVGQIKGQAKLKNSHGNIQAEVYGDVDVENRHANTKLVCHGEKVIADNGHGELTVRVMNPKFNQLELENSHGDIKVRVPIGVTPSVTMKTSHGSESSNVESNASSSQKIQAKASHGDISIKYQN